MSIIIGDSAEGQHKQWLNFQLKTFLEKTPIREKRTID
jgi:hypothetical protein